MNIEELKRLAEAATPGQWSESDGYAGVVAGKQFIAQAYGDRRADCINNAAYIAAANPAAILELIRQRDELLAKLDRAQAEIRELESNLLDATTKPTRICEACATYPCKCE